MLLLLVADPEHDLDRCRNALLLALNTHRTTMLEEVRVLLFGAGVKVLDPIVDEDGVLSDLLRRLVTEGVGVAACSGSLLELGLGGEARALGVTPAGAQVYLAARINAGVAVVTF
jgi:hypothetical protein